MSDKAHNNKISNSDDNKNYNIKVKSNENVVSNTGTPNSNIISNNISDSSFRNSSNNITPDNIKLSPKRDLNNNIKLNYDYKCELIVIGDSTVGKTSLISSYNSNVENETEIVESLNKNSNKNKNHLAQVATVGVDYITKDITINGKVIRTKIWDTAGQERYRALTDNFVKNANGVILVYDINNLSTFLDLKYWIQYINLKANKNVKKILIGNKIDLERLVQEEDAHIFAETFGLKYYETSVKNKCKIINESFNWLIKDIFESGILPPNLDKNRKICDNSDKIKKTKKDNKKCC